MTLIDTRFDTHDLAAFVPSALPQVVSDPIVIEDERAGDADAREALLDRAFGPARFRKTCQKLRAGRVPARGLSLVARRGGGQIVGSVRLWHVEAGGVAALMLGPLAVDSRYRCHGIGARLMDEALARAASLGHRAVLLVGDAPYYAKFGFDRRHTLALQMPGVVEDARFLGLEIEAGALAMARGLVKPTGVLVPPHRRPTSRPTLKRAA